MPDTTLPNTNGSTDDSAAGDLLPVSLDSLQVNGVAPQSGDTVKFEVEGTVDHVDQQSGVAYVKPEKANGQDIPDGDQSQEPTEDDLQAKAEQADQQSYGQ